MVKKLNKNAARKKRHMRIRNKINGTAECPRLNVFRSSKNIYAQLIDDERGATLVAASSLDKNYKGNGSNKEGAYNVGAAIAKKALEKSIKKVVFDRGGYVFHGRIAKLAEGAREGGLEF